jgi:hypothetical protein
MVTRSGGGPNDERLRVLGAVVEAAAKLDGSLESLFCALVGSKYAAVLCAGLPTLTLVDDCKALTRANREIDEVQRADLQAVLADCSSASKARGKLVHSVFIHDVRGSDNAMRRSRRNHQPTIETASIEHVTKVERDLKDANWRLWEVTVAVLGLDAAGLDAQLRWEDHVAGLTDEERNAMIEARKEAALRKLRGQ